MISTPLTDMHRQQQRPLMEWQGASWPRQFTDPLAEYHAVTTGVGLFDGSALGVLELTGQDRASFLHGLVTNDVRGLPRDQACWVCTLTPKGYVESFGLLVHGEDAHRLIVPRWLIPRLLALFERYHIIEDVQVTDRSATYILIGVQGATAAAFLAQWTRSTVPCTTPMWTTVTIDHMAIGCLGHHPLGYPGALLFVPTRHAVSIWEQCQHAGAAPVGLRAFQMLRVEAGLVWYGVDADDTCLLPETGWERMATSFTKGCYVGQEVVARATQRGRVNRHVVGLQFSSSDPLNVPLELALDDASCGLLTSAAWSPHHQCTVGLGMVSRKAWAAPTPLTVRGHAHLTARPIALPQLPLPAYIP